MLIKNYISNLVLSVDTSIGEQIWLRFKSSPELLFGFCYVPPCDSEYYSHESFAAIQEKIITNHMNDGYSIIGDLNTRFGKFARDIPILSQLPSAEVYSYPEIEDDIPFPNNNAEILSTICIDNKLILINNLKTGEHHFIGGKTYKRRDTWISELDTCIASPCVVNRLSNFEVVKCSDLPSDHAPVTVTVSLTGVDLNHLEARASQLGDYSALDRSPAKTKYVRKPIKINCVNKDLFKENISLLDIPDTDIDINNYANEVSNVLYECVEKSRYAGNIEGHNTDNVTLGRWERLLNDRDDSQVWRAINWKGEWSDATNQTTAGPTDDDFKIHFESLLNPPGNNGDIIPTDYTTITSIPILDDPISVNEVTEQVHKMKPDKACGPDGVSPGLLSLLPGQWILAITTLFNNVFLSGSYPEAWNKARLFTIFKRGDKNNTNNYRGISVINCISKLYDMILCERLNHWFKPYREQAGAQRKRSCLEHIVTLRIITDYAKRKKLKLFVTFVDFTKAYDLVPRNILFRLLKRMGCGMVMLAALVAIYVTTESVIGTAIVTATLGVRQGSPTSCILFIIFINDLIKTIKSNCNVDGFLQWLHILVLMDDTVLLATSRASMIRKIILLQNYCTEYGMRINKEKTKFFVINGGVGDSESITVNNLTIDHCNSYIYLGSPFTSDGSISSAVNMHAKLKMSHVLKYISFLRKNNDIPFIVKKRVFDAALMSSILYGCESWLGADFRPVIKLYNWSLKQLLGVRRTTTNQVCYAESGYPPLPDLIKYKQHKYFFVTWPERENIPDDPLSFAINLVKNTNTPNGKLIKYMIQNRIVTLSDAMDGVRSYIQESDTSRCNTYKDINPDCSVHSIYTKKHNINEVHRISFTRFRVCGHSLAIETGRWNRRGRGRLPVEERLCVCGLVQTERHVIENCSISQRFRDRYHFNTLEDLFSDNFSDEMKCQIIHEILLLYV